MEITCKQDVSCFLFFLVTVQTQHNYSVRCMLSPLQFKHFFFLHNLEVVLMFVVIARAKSKEHASCAGVCSNLWGQKVNRNILLVL